MKRENKKEEKLKTMLIVADICHLSWRWHTGSM
jgi:hypothetical protein